MEQSIKGYKWDGDPDGLKMMAMLNDQEIETILYCVKNKGEANIRDTKYNCGYEITKSQDGIFMVSKVEISTSWF